MKTEERQRVLEQLFNDIAKLPDGEIERLRVSVDKKVLKWEGLPTQAPELFKERCVSETLPQFLERVYANRGWLDGRLTRAHLAVLDPQLGTAVSNWINHHGLLPRGINLPFKYGGPLLGPKAK